MSASKQLATITTAVCVPVAIVGVLLVGWLPTLLGVGVVGGLCYALAGFMRWADGA